MSEIAAEILWRLNVAANGVGRFILAPIGWGPAWLSNAIVAAIAGVGMLLVFKHTSNQKAIGRVRDGIKADMLTLKLFKDSLAVSLVAQGRMLRGAMMLFVWALVPIAVMTIPICLLLSQMGLWYQYDPAPLGGDVIVTVALNDDDDTFLESVFLERDDSFEIVAGPMRAPAQGEVWWTIRGLQEGQHKMTFDVAGRKITKSLAFGHGPMRVSKRRPDMSLSGVLLYPAERPFNGDSVFRWIDVQYERRPGWANGADAWVITFFVVSVVFALLFKNSLGTRL